MAGTKGKGKKRGGMPVDIMKLLEAMDDLSQARDLPVSINVVIDATASDKLINLMLETFSTQSETTRVEHVVLGAEVPQLPLPSDLCVIVGGESLLLGEVAAASRRVGCPAVVVVETGETYFAESEDDVVDILGLDEDGAPVGIPEDDIVDICFDDERPLEELGRWIAVNAPAKRIAMAASFGFLRYPLAMELTNLIALKNAGVGIVFIVPGADMPIITLNQAKLVLQIASIYGQPLDMSRATEIAAVVAGAFGFRALARELTDFIPVLGWGIKGTIAYAGTVSMGRAAIDYFEEGGRINGLASAITQAVESVTEQVTSAMEPLEQ